jgi:hypothetical protein
VIQSRAPSSRTLKGRRSWMFVSSPSAAIIPGSRKIFAELVDRGDLGRVPGIRHVKIPLEHVINLSRGLNKDGSEPK